MEHLKIVHDASFRLYPFPFLFEDQQETKVVSNPSGESR